MNIGDTFQHKDILLRIERQRSEYSCQDCAFSIENKKREQGCLATSEEYFAKYCMQCGIIFVSVTGRTMGTFIERRRQLLTLR